MRAIKARLCAAALAVLLASCGGGSSSSDTSGEATPQAVAPLTLTQGAHKLTFTPGKVVATVEQGGDASVEILVEAKGGYATRAFAILEDPEQATKATAYLEPLGNQRYRTVIPINATMPLGRHTGSINVIMCADDFCNDRIDAAPWQVPYEITVTAAAETAPSALAAIPGVPDWTSLQGGIAHTGYVPLTVTKFAKRWTWTTPFTSTNRTWAIWNGLNGVATLDGTVYLSTGKGIAKAGFSNYVFALSEDKGQELWRADLGDLYQTSAPTVTQDHVFVSSSGHEDTAIWKLDRRTGAILQRSRFASQWAHYLAPAVLGDRLYNVSGSNGGFTAWSTSTGEADWTLPWSNIDSWVPTVNDQYVLTYSPGKVCCQERDGTNGLLAIDPQTGDTVFSIENKTTTQITTAQDAKLAPVLTPHNTVVTTTGRPVWFSQNELLRFDLGTRTLTWRASGAFPSNPVYANGVVYIARSKPFRLEARREADGTLLWTWQEPRTTPEPTDPVVANGLDPAHAGSLAVTDSHVFVSSTHAVYAINLTSQKQDWRYPRAGELAISSRGVLYIALRSVANAGANGGFSFREGRVVAVSLR